MTIRQNNQDLEEIAERTAVQSAELTARTVPDRSLRTPGIGPVVKDLLQKNNTVYFGEWHDDANDKFLADNPDIFKEARAQGGSKVFTETRSATAPLYKSYFAGQTSEADFKKNLNAFSGRGYTSGDTSEAVVRQKVAMARTAKENGMSILPSDFRDLDPNKNSRLNYTSDAYGISDVQERKDAVRRQTELSLEEYRKTYPQRNGIPTTYAEQQDFSMLHGTRIAELNGNEKAQFDKDLSARAKEFRSDPDPSNVAYQNKLQATYYKTQVQPGEKALFFGGRNHMTDKQNTGEILEKGGYGTTANVQLLGDGGALHNVANKINGSSTPNAQLSKPVDYTVLTEQGKIFKGTEPPKGEETVVTLPPAPPTPVRNDQKGVESSSHPEEYSFVNFSTPKPEPAGEAKKEPLGVEASSHSDYTFTDYTRQDKPTGPVPDTAPAPQEIAAVVERKAPETKIPAPIPAPAPS